MGLALAGGELLLHAEGVRVLRAGLDALQRSLARDGIGVPPSVVDVLQLLDGPADCRALSVRTAGSGSPAVPPAADPARSALLDPVSVQEAAEMLRCQPRNVRDLCARGAFPSARRVDGRWLLERADVLDRRRAA